MTRNGQRGQVVISADSHVMEPADLWTSRVDRNRRDLAPEVRPNEGRPGYSFHAPGLAPVDRVGFVGCRAQRRRAQGAPRDRGVRVGPTVGLGPRRRV